jgi:hypothetical protein
MTTTPKAGLGPDSNVRILFQARPEIKRIEGTAAGKIRGFCKTKNRREKERSKGDGIRD